MGGVGFEEEEAADAEFIEIRSPQRFDRCAVIECHASDDNGAADFTSGQIPSHDHIHTGLGDRIAEALVDVAGLVVRAEADAFHFAAAEDGTVGTNTHEEWLVLRGGGGEVVGVGCPAW